MNGKTTETMPKKISDLTAKTTLNNTDSFVLSDGVLGSDRRITKENLLDALDGASITYVDDKASLLSSEIEAAKKGFKGFATKADMDAFTPASGDPEIAQVMNDSIVGNNGEYRWDGTAWIKRDSLAEVKQIKNWVGSETFDSITDMVFSDAGNLESANLIYLDGIAGTISNLVEDSEGRLTSLRYNRPDNKYITYGVTYDANGIPTPTLTATGY